MAKGRRPAGLGAGTGKRNSPYERIESRMAAIASRGKGFEVQINSIRNSMIPFAEKAAVSGGGVGEVQAAFKQFMQKDGRHALLSLKPGMEINGIAPLTERDLIFLFERQVQGMRKA